MSLIPTWLGLALLAASPAPDSPPVAREFRAVWVATVENIDWPTRPGLRVDQQKAEAVAILDDAVRLNLNAIVLQVRTAADALYDSPIEPWSYYLTGEQGKAPEPYYDPLRFWLDESHKRGLVLHAWINPFRARIAGAKYADSTTHVDRTHPDWSQAYGTARWLDPGEPGAFDQTLKVISDLAKRYDLDGLHIDDYFYPYPIPDPDHPGQELPFPDDASWAKARAAGFTGKRDDWRRDNINRLVQQMMATVRRERPQALVGISPFGIPRPGQPAGVVGFDQYDKLYADAVLWLRNGWCDYIAPQLYWKVDAPGQPFRPLLNYWVEQNVHGRHVWPGLSSSRVNPGPKGYQPSEIFRQIEIIRETPGASGSILFSQKSLRNNRLGLTDQLGSGPFAQPALVPPSPWLSATPPGRPEVTVQPDGKHLLFLPRPAASGGSVPFVWLVQVSKGSGWETTIHPAAATTPIRVAGDGDMVVWAVDRLGNVSEPQSMPTR